MLNDFFKIELVTIGPILVMQRIGKVCLNLKS
jgi:hypothetical protein